MTSSTETSTPQTVGESLPDHLIPLYGEWAMWRCAGVRGAGFPAELVDRLSRSEAAAASDRLGAAETARAEAFEAAREQVDRLLDALRAEGGWHDRTRRKPLSKAWKRLSKEKVDEKVERVVGKATVERIEAAEAEVEAARAGLALIFDEALLEQAEQLRAIARNDAFREAVLLQNRHAYHTALRKIAESEPDLDSRNSQHRQHEALVALYLQRYALKNDTIGFFGPMGWASFREDAGTLEIEPASEMVESRETFLEAWGLIVLAEVFAEDPSLRPFLRPRPLPDLQIAGRRVSSPLRSPLSLDPASLALLRAVDGERTAREVVALAIADPAAADESEQRLYERLDGLEEKGLVVLGFQVGRDPAALARLRRQLEESGEDSVTAPFLSRLDELETARRRIAEAAGDPDRLDARIRELSEVYRRITGEAATRRRGETYGSRTLFYEDSRRGAEISFGPALVEELGPTLDLLLRSGRWYIGSVGRALLEVARGSVRELSANGEEVDVVEFIRRMTPWVHGKRRGELGRPLDAELRAKWQRILGPFDPSAQHVSLRSEDLRPRAEEELEIADALWEFGRYHAPDVMVATASAEAASRGDYELVLGEMHIGHNTLNNWGLLVHHPRREEVFEWIDSDLPGPGIDITDERVFTDQSRIAAAHRPEGSFLLPLLERMIVLPDRPRLRTGELRIVETSDGTLLLEAPERGLSVDLLELFSVVAMDRMLNAYSPLGVDGHRPRISIDRMVVWREAWSFEATDLAWSDAADELERFHGARRWARAHGIPDRTFVRIPTERKPFFADLSSPVLVEQLSKAVRGTRDWHRKNRTVTFTEMYPDTSDLWLVDAEGRHYTSELRLIVLDRRR